MSPPNEGQFNWDEIQQDMEHRAREMRDRIEAMAESIKRIKGLDVKAMSEAENNLIMEYLRYRTTTLELNAAVLPVFAALQYLARRLLILVVDDEPEIPNPVKDLELMEMGQMYFDHEREIQAMVKQARRQCAVALDEAIKYHKAGTLSQVVARMREVMPVMPHFPITEHEVKEEE